MSDGLVYHPARYVWPYVAALTIGAILAPSTEPVLYSVTLAKPGDAAISVSLTLPSAVAGPLTLVIPRAVPMGYSQQLYDRYVSDVAARGANGEVVPHRTQGGIALANWLSRRQRSPGELPCRPGEDGAGAAERDGLIARACRLRRHPRLLGVRVTRWNGGPPGQARGRGPAGLAGVHDARAGGACPAGTSDCRGARLLSLADSQVAMGPALSVVRLDSRVPLYLAASSEGAADLTFTGTLIAQAISGLLEYFGSPPFAQY